MPEGGFLKGEAKIVSMDNPDIVQASYNTETDPASVTVAEAKKIVAKKVTNGFDSKPIMPRGSFPPKIDKGKYIVLAAGGTYRSQAFSGSGWRFGGIGEKPADGTGHFLRWKSYIDDGRVGNINQATTTKGGVLVEGMPLYAREGFKYFAPNGPSWTMDIGIYYTYNPVKDTYYVVQNI